MRIFMAAVLCAAVILFVPSCSDNTVEPPDTGYDKAVAIVDKFCNAVVDPFCDASFACCHIYGRNIGGGDVNSCKKFFAYFSELSTGVCGSDKSRKNLEAALQAGTVVFDQSQLDTCLARLKSLSAGGEACTVPAVDVINFDCIAAFRGQVPPGGACTSFRPFAEYNTLECKDGLCENDKCVPFLKTGDPCFIPFQSPDWTKSTYCNFLKRESCHGERDYVGEDATGDGSGFCAPRVELGEACHALNDGECNSATCDETGKCVPPESMWRICRGSL